MRRTGKEIDGQAYSRPTFQKEPQGGTTHETLDSGVRHFIHAVHDGLLLLPSPRLLLRSPRGVSARARVLCRARLLRHAAPLLWTLIRARAEITWSEPRP